MFSLLQYLNPTRSYSLLCTSRCNKNPQKITTSLPYCLEAIQPEHLKIAVVSYLHMYYTCTKFEKNLRRVSIFRVDLTWNDPIVSQCFKSLHVVVLPIWMRKYEYYQLQMWSDVKFALLDAETRIWHL